MDQVRDVHIQQDMMPNVRAGGFDRVYRVTFYVADHGPFTELFQPLEFNADAVKERMRLVSETLSMIPGAQVDKSKRPVL